ncbi:hypothetical protein EYZ11_010141 [Aspergillus tanneri]|uniref:Uncharacterized protein n=1 Tax=Aspergillus tanneri TaxID=1220188 RepID=A0A4S3J649_9EURO|nr:hypothetical protein EYZ11_010141 [Aspergillus tanneri]
MTASPIILAGCQRDWKILTRARERLDHTK